MGQVLRGHGIGTGIATGPALHMGAPIPEPDHAPLQGSAEQAWESASFAANHVSEYLASAASSLEGEAKDILEAQALIAKDSVVLDDVRNRIDGGQNPERAVFEAYARFREMLSTMGGFYADRAADLDDISQRIRAEIAGIPAPGVPKSTEPFVLVATDLSPADTAMLNYDLVRALITEGGGPTGHTAILARSKGLPAIIGCEGALDILEGAEVLVNAAHGTVIVDPSEEDLKQAEEERRARTLKLKASKAPGRLKDGIPIALLANLGSPEEAAEAVVAGAEGVGLFRTEFLFLGTSRPPSKEEQVAAYKRLLDAFPKQKVVVRLLDAGADKPLPYLGDEDEANPALGARGYRALLRQEDILNTQLEALAEAGRKTDADLWVMAPMIADTVESAEFTERAHAAGLGTAGVMAEIPSLAVLADQVVQITDFVSIGTNDLTQYAMAADRTLVTVGDYQDPWHPAVLRLIKMLGAASREAGKPLGVCGEASADPDLAAVLVGLGVDSLSMAVTALPEVRLRLTEITLEQTQAAAAAACNAISTELARAAALAILDS